MGYERYPRGTNPQGDYYGRTDPQDYGRDYGSGRDYSYSSARDYRAAGQGGDRGRQDYGQRDAGQGYGYGQRDGYGAGRGGGDYNRGDHDQGGQRRGYGREEYHGSYASDGRRFEDTGRYSHGDDDTYRQGGDRDRGDGRQPQGYGDQDRGFFQRAGDEVRSWFGDEDAERRREQDARYEERENRYGGGRDSDYHNWRSSQVAALDRDYDEYRRENRSKFENEFATWRTNRQGQRDQLGKVTEHMDVVGSDGEHVGTVDKTRGDRILLTKSDKDAEGHHHSIPSSWIQTVDTKVTLNRTAKSAKDTWKDEESSQAMFGDRPDTGGAQTRDSQGRVLGRSFSGTY